MLIAYPFSLKDQDQALKNAHWIASLKNNNDHRFVVVYDARTDPDLVKKVFGAKVVGELKVTDVHNRWPHSANTMFAQAARYIQTMPDYKYWLWLEPDAIPLGHYALDKIENEYLRAKALFMGARCNSWKNCPAHLSGIAVYPNPLINYAGLMLLSDGEATPFDVICAEQVITQSHLTDLIQNVARKMNRVGDTWIPEQEARSYSSKDDFYSVATQECVLFHSDKQGTLIDIFGGAGDQREDPKPQETLVPPSPIDLEWAKPTPPSGYGENQNTLSYHVQWLKDYAAKDGFARMRVYRALIRAGLSSPKGKQKQQPKKRGKRK